MVLKEIVMRIGVLFLCRVFLFMLVGRSGKSYIKLSSKRVMVFYQM